MNTELKKCARCGDEAFENRIERQSEEIRRLLLRLHDVTRSRDHWKSEAKRIGNQLSDVLKQKRVKEDGEDGQNQ